ncbi:aerobic carbon-monoxide dehydrogenase medium subunit [Rhizobiaceae bacterium]|nr:aerobic carbon-monoxide dehydrogenase medium subunit [Rhizobiaceae bacterium]
MPLRVETFDRIEDAARALQGNRNARVIGGGTLLMRGVNTGIHGFDTVIVVRGGQSREVHSDGTRLEIGAGVTMAAIAASPELAFLAPAARVVGGPAVRAAATVGGNLFARPPFGELTTALLALGAQVHYVGHGSPQPIEDFLRERGRDRTRIVRAVSLPRIGDPSAFRFFKVTRVAPKGAAILSIAAHMPVQGGRVSGARIAVSNMGPTPLRAIGAERALEGQPLNDDTAQRAAAAMMEGLSPLTDELASEWYRREVAPVHLRRLLQPGYGR